MNFHLITSMNAPLNTIKALRVIGAMDVNAPSPRVESSAPDPVPLITEAHTPTDEPAPLEPEQTLDLPSQVKSLPRPADACSGAI